MRDQDHDFVGERRAIPRMLRRCGFSSVNSSLFSWHYTPPIDELSARVPPQRDAVTSVGLLRSLLSRVSRRRPDQSSPRVVVGP